MRGWRPGGAAIVRRCHAFRGQLPAILARLEIEPEEATFADYANIVAGWLAAQSRGCLDHAGYIRRAEANAAPILGYRKFQPREHHALVSRNELPIWFAMTCQQVEPVACP